MELIDALFDLCKTVPRPIIAIDGPAGAGKTTLADHLSTAMSLRYKTTTIHMDSLYNGWDHPFDHNLTDSLLTAATSHKRATAFSLPRYDWTNHRYVSGEAIAQSELLILEGVGSSQIALRPYLAATIWIEIDREKGLERVLLRDGDSISQEMKQWLREQEQHFLENDSQNAADFVLTN
jgi:uridine kinase